MGLFGSKNKKKKGQDGTVDNTVAESKASAKEEKKRLKRIEKMCNKFDETVWVSVVDVLREQIPDFVTTYEDEKQFVTFALDTSQHPINDFENAKDPDVGQLYNVIKTEMDVIIENGLLANELILFIPTEKTLKHMADYADEFDFKYKIVLCKNDDDAGDYTVMTYNGSKDPIVITFADIDAIVCRHDIGASISTLAANKERNNTDNIDGVDELLGGETDNANADNDDDIDGADVVNDNRPEETAENENEPEETVENDNSTEESGDENAQEESSNDDSDNNESDQNEISDESGEDTSGDTTEESNISVESLTNAVAEASEQAMDKDDSIDPKRQSLSDKVRAKREAKRLNKAVAKAVDVASQDEEIQKQQRQRMQPVNTPQVLTVADIDNFIVRKFYSDDLGLEVSTEPFDAAIVSGNRYQPFEYIPESVSCSEWLNEYINNLRADANTKLMRMHQENITMLREHYVLLVTRHCEDIVKHLDINDPNTKYGAMKITLNQKRSDDASKLQDKIASEIAKLNDERKKMLQDKIEAAKAAAINSFNREIAPTFEQKEKNIRNVMSTDIEVAYTEGLNTINAARREEAKRQLDIGINEILKNIHDEYAKMLAIEREEYNRLQGIISEFEKSNMAADMAHAHTIQAELDRSNKVAEIQAEYESKIGLIKSEFELKLEAAYEDIHRKSIEHNDQISKLKEQHDVYVAKLEAARDDQVLKLNGEIDSLNEQLRVMSERYVELDQVTNEKYRNQIDEIKSEREAWEERADHLEQMHKYTDRVKITVAIISAMAALGIGVILGASYMANKVKNTQQSNAPKITYHTNDEKSSKDTANTDADTNEDNTGSVNDSKVDETSSEDTANTDADTNEDNTGSVNGGEADE